MEERVVLASVATGRFSAVIDQVKDARPILHISFVKKEANQQGNIDIPVDDLAGLNSVLSLISVAYSQRS